MGWTGMHREKGLSDREFFEREFPVMLTQRGRIVACASKGGVFYAAVRNHDDADYMPGKTWALVVLKQWSRGEWNFAYKEMSEAMGPAEDECPPHILDLLSPTHSQWANEWRQRCRAVAEKQARSKLTAGDVIVMARALTFTNGQSVHRFRYEQSGGRFTALDDDDRPLFMCKLGRSWWRREWHRAV